VKPKLEEAKMVAACIAVCTAEPFKNHMLLYARISSIKILMAFVAPSKMSIFGSVSQVFPFLSPKIR
jgi:hypothetical protein